MIKKVETMCSYNGHSIGNNGNLNLKLKCRYSELVNYIQLVQMLNNDIQIEVKQVGSKVFGLGVFRLKQISIDHDGEGTITLNSMSDSVEIDNLNLLVIQTKGEEIKAKFKSDIEVEDEDWDGAEEDDAGWADDEDDEGGDDGWD